MCLRHTILLALVAFILLPAQAVHNLCGQYETFYQSPYLWNNDAWNENGSTGSVCTYVSTNPSKVSNAFYVLWKWAGAPVVRAFPNVGLDTVDLPIKLSNLTSLKLSATWDLKVSTSDDTSTLDLTELEANSVQANVCLDTFADLDEETSQDASTAAYEVMIWFGQFGDAALPVGNTAPLDPPITASLGEYEFNLYMGNNSNNQTVHTWLANSTLTSFDVDVAPLYVVLNEHGLLSNNNYVGTVSFGSETFGATSQVNFSVSSFEATIEAKTNATKSGSSSKSGAARSLHTPLSLDMSLVGISALMLPWLLGWALVLS